MEETVRALLKYKSKFEQLKHDRHSVTNSYEVSKTVLFLLFFFLKRRAINYYIIMGRPKTMNTRCIIFRTILYYYGGGRVKRAFPEMINVTKRNAIRFISFSRFLFVRTAVNSCRSYRRTIFHVAYVRRPIRMGTRHLNWTYSFCLL